MSLYDYQKSKEIAAEDYPFYALIMAAMRQADSNNIDLLKFAFSETWHELEARYNSPGGFLPDDKNNNSFSNYPGFSKGGLNE